MNNTRPHRGGDAAYIESGAWKCSKSPTGAHYWIITKEMKRCKYCGEVRDFRKELRQGGKEESEGRLERAVLAQHRKRGRPPKAPLKGGGLV